MAYLEAAIQGFTWGYTWGIPVGGIISSKAAGCMSAVLVEVGPFVGVFQVLLILLFLIV